MNWWSWIVTFSMPALVVGYIIWDLTAHKYTPNHFGNPQMTADPKIDKLLFPDLDEKFYPEPSMEEQRENFERTLEQMKDLI